MTTVSAAASCCTRAATFRVSPNTSSSMTTGPVCMATRTASRTPGVRLREAARRVPLLRIDHAERLEERLDRDVAPLDPLLGDPSQEPPETTATDRRRDRHGLGAELLDDDLVHRLTLEGELAG